MALTQVRPEGLGFVNGRRNLIINGAMQVAQRGTSFSSAANNTYVVDRFRVKRNGMDNLVYDLSQSSTSPDGFGNSIKLDVTTAETSSADGEYLKIDTTIEAQNVQQLKYGTSSAEQITMSFWVRSSTTGTYAIEMYTEDPDKQITNTFTVNSANTFEYKTVTFVGDTGGSINNDNGQGFLISWFLSVPSNYKTGDSTSWRTYNADGRGYGQTADVASTTGEFYITGVQLEVGTNASDFEHESYAETLRKCQRYFYRLGGKLNGATGYRGTVGTGVMFSPTLSLVDNKHPTAMRAPPDVTFNGTLGSTAAEYQMLTNLTVNYVNTVGTNNSDVDSLIQGLTAHNSSTDGAAVVVRALKSTSTVDVDAEL
jgi:hypothetical protein